MQFDFTVTKWDLTFEGVCTADYSPATPDVMYLSNGDPGYPGDPAELSVTKVTITAIDEVALEPPLEVTDIDSFTNDFYGELCRAAEEQIQAADEAQAEAMADDWREQQAERARE